MGEPRLSIVTITYKDTKGLSETIDSLRALRAGPARGFTWDHVVIDSSPEENRALLAALSKEGWPLVHIVTPAEGIYAAINTGLEKSQGEYLWFLNGGDRLREPSALNHVFEVFSQDPGLDFIASTAEFQRDGKFMYMHRPYPWVIRSLVGMNRLCHQGIVYKRQVFTKVGGFSRKLKLAADYEHHLRCIAAGIRIKALPDNLLAVYDMSGRSMQYKQAFEEFQSIQRELGPKLPPWLNLGNQIVRPLELTKVTLMKVLGDTPLAGVLKPLWLGLKRKQ